MIQVTIGNVDMYGLLGRDLHPEKTDSGRTAKLISSVQEDLGDSGAVANGDEKPGEFVFNFLTVEFEDGRRVELAEYEVTKLEVVLD